MDKRMTDTAPFAPTMTESARQYMNSGAIALQLSRFIASCGYSATAHIDGVYDFALPLVAQDCKLGIIGRMGLLMHPVLGPRCRIAVVSTDFPLDITPNYKPDVSMIDFCRLCKKCADNCPSAAISRNDRKIIDGVNRWKIDQEQCYTYWTIAGTDCARCITVCPYSHENNLLHRFIRFGIKNNFLFRQLAVRLDDVFYGRKPKRKPNRKLELS